MDGEVRVGYDNSYDDNDARMYIVFRLDVDVIVVDVGPGLLSMKAFELAHPRGYSRCDTKHKYASV